MSPQAARERFATATHALLATADRGGAPHIVPIVFALAGETIYNAVDRKPKRTSALRRLANVRANPQVAVLAEHYSDDWSALWWVRAEGAARVIEAADAEAVAALELLAQRYAPYREAPPPGPLLAIDVARWSGWEASPG
ncbi:MAG TPA: TIGR03668 family PPOX class F420-dependent oxidoreductase [Solirubrobacteraceae bacterium]